MTGFSFHITKGMEKKNEKAEKANDNSLEITGSASLQATGWDGNTESSCLPVFQSNFFPFDFRESHFGWFRGPCIRTNGVPFAMTLC